MATKRQVFYSFHYKPDNWRSAQVREIGFVEGNKIASDNDWETIKRGGDSAIKKWIDAEMKYKSCTVVLVGEKTANRKWINHEIIESWNKGMGVVGIHIHGLKNRLGDTSQKGKNPFDYLTCGNAGKKLSSIVKCYNPAGNDSRQRYAWIEKHLSYAIEEAIQIRK